MNLRLFVSVAVMALICSCAGPDPVVECRNWVRAHCERARRCDPSTDVEQCVARNIEVSDADSTCPDSLADPYCSDLGDDFIRCADEVKAASCGDTSVNICILHTNARSTCEIPPAQ